MYNNISNDAKTALKSRVVTTTARITLTSNNQVIDGNNLVNVTITDQCYQDGVIVGTAMCKEVEIELIDNNYDLVDKEFSLEVGVLLPNSSYEYIPYGNFIIKDYQKIISSNHYKLIAYDYMDKFNATFVDNNPTLEDGVTYTTPMTLQSFYQYVANQFGVTIETQANLPNANFSITTKPYLEGLSGRNVLSRIAEMMGCFAKINRNNKLEMKLKNVTAEQFSRNEMNNSLERDNRFGPINVISLRLSQVEGENVTKRDESSISQYGETTLQIQDNPFCYTEALRLAAINAIYNKVDGFSYYPTTFNGKLIYLDAGDEVEVQDMETDTYYKTIILKQVLKIPSTRNSKFENKALTDTGLQYQFTPEQVRKDRRTEFLVDKQNGVIQQIVETTEEIEHQFETLQDIDGFAEGKYIYLDDASNELITSAKFNGETSQATRSGKNLLNKNATALGSNVTKTVLDTGVRVTTKVAGTNRYCGIEIGKDELLGKTVTINATITLSGTNNARAKLYFGTSSSPAISSFGTELNTTGSRTVTIPNSFYTNTDRIYLLLYSNVNGDTSVNNYVDYTNLQVEIGSQATSYEPYGVMPSPDYPSEIENLEGKNIFDETQLLQATGWTKNSEGYYTGTTSNLYAKFKLDAGGFHFAKSFKENTRYILSWTAYTSSGTGNPRFRIYYTNNTYQDCTNWNYTTPTKMSTVSAANKTIDKIVYSYGDNPGTIYIKDIQLEEGTVATPYVPYNSLEVKVINNNLFDTTKDFISSNIAKNLWTITQIDTGLRLISNYSSGQPYVRYVVADLSNAIGKTVRLKSDFVASSTNKGSYRIGMCKIDGSSGRKAVTTQTSGKEISYIVDYVEDNNWLFVDLFSNASGGTQSSSAYVDYTNIMLTIDDEDMTYIEHEHQMVYFPLEEGQKLYEGSYLADDGIHNVRGQYKFTGNEQFVKSAENDNFIRFYSPVFTNIIKTTDYETIDKFRCSHFKSVAAYNNAENCIALNGGRFYPSISKTIVTDLSTFKTWLSNNTPIVEYPLAEEEIIPYNTEQQAAWNSIRELHTYKTVTHIYSDAYAEIGYIKDNMLSDFETKASAQLTKNDVSQLKIENGRISSEVSSTQSQFNNYYTKNEADNNTNSTKAELQNIIQQNKTEVEQTTQALNLRVSSIETNGVDKIETSMGYTFNNEGLNIDKEGAATASTIDNEAFKVKNKSANENVFFAGYVSDQDSAYRGQTIVESTNLVVKNYLNIEGASRFQPYVNPVLGGHGTGAFDIG